MDFINALALIVGGILSVSGLIVAKKPNAKELIDKLVPFQALIGVGLLALGVVNLLRWLGHHVFDLIKITPMYGATMLSMVVTSILLGFMFGMPQIAQWLPGNGVAEQKGMELSRQLAPFQGIIGLIGLATGLLVLLYQFHIVPTSW
jgi:hypothetical protein